MHDSYPLIFIPSALLLLRRAQMSFAPEHLENPDMSTLSEQDLQVLQDWADKMEKKYPVVGTIAGSSR